jgi:hypothetical protein
VKNEATTAIAPITAATTNAAWTPGMSGAPHNTDALVMTVCRTTRHSWRSLGGSLLAS